MTLTRRASSGRFSRSRIRMFPEGMNGPAIVDRLILAKLESKGLRLGGRRRQADADPPRNF